MAHNQAQTNNVQHLAVGLADPAEHLGRPCRTRGGPARRRQRCPSEDLGLLRRADQCGDCPLRGQGSVSEPGGQGARPGVPATLSRSVERLVSR